MLCSPRLALNPQPSFLSRSSKCCDYRPVPLGPELKTTHKRQYGEMTLFLKLALRVFFTGNCKLTEKDMWEVIGAFGMGC